MKPITYFLTLLIVCFPNFTSIAFSQKVVVSEYFNYPGATAQLEWTEILVLEDNISLVGWSVHDYSGDLSARVNGPVFKDIPLWKHLRAGTIIVIDHRLTTPAQPTDSDPSDGYIQVMQLDADFFQSAEEAKKELVGKDNKARTVLNLLSFSILSFIILTLKTKTAPTNAISEIPRPTITGFKRKLRDNPLTSKG